MPPPNPRRGLTLLETLVAIAVVALLIGLLVVAVQQTRQAAGRAQCANNLRQIGVGLHNYHGVFNQFPPGIGDTSDPYPFLGWTARILPQIDQADLWQLTTAAYAETPNFQADPPHAGFATVMPVYACPADSRVLMVGNCRGLAVALTSYVGVEGTNQFDGDGILFLNSSVRINEITDGTSNTLLVGERPPAADLTLGWWYAGYGQNQDGSAEMLLGVNELCYGPWSPAGCATGPYEFSPGSFTNPCDVLHFWSPHSGGANFLFADGSTRFLGYAAAPLMPALATRAGGESVSDAD